MSPDSPPGGRPDYKVYRSRKPLFGRRDEPGFTGPGSIRGADQPRKTRKPWTFGRVLRYLVLGVLGWLALSLVLFLLSAQFEQEHVSSNAEKALDGPVLPIVGDETILVLGSDARVKGLAEPGSAIGGPSRSDTIMLVRAGIGTGARLSIPRDTVVEIPGHGEAKINAAYAIGGAALAITTVKRYLDIKINHVVEVNFENFPAFVDSLGGIDYTGPAVLSEINGGEDNGGTTLEIPGGTTHLNGSQTLALARTRINQRNSAEGDVTRAERQQKIFNGIRSSLLSPSTFVRLPWVSWEAPKTIRSDMSGPSLLGLFTRIASGGSPQTRVLKPSGVTVLPDGGSGLVVSDSDKRAEVRRFLGG